MYEHIIVMITSLNALIRKMRQYIYVFRCSCYAYAAKSAAKIAMFFSFALSKLILSLAKKNKFTSHVQKFMENFKAYRICIKQTNIQIFAVCKEMVDNPILQYISAYLLHAIKHFS